MLLNHDFNFFYKIILNVILCTPIPKSKHEITSLDDDELIGIKFFIVVYF